MRLCGKIRTLFKEVATENFKMEKEDKKDNKRTEERNETNRKEKSLHRKLSE